jgi:hypothetical protein
MVTRTLAAHVAKYFQKIRQTRSRGEYLVYAVQQNKEAQNVNKLMNFHQI